jgi:hypothetical protein
VQEFQAELKASGVLALYRRSRGGDIAAACGQLVVAAGKINARKAGAPTAIPESSAKAPDKKRATHA